jgi:hypothetical protein
MPAKIEIPLDLPEIRILNTEPGGREIVITVEGAREWAICANAAPKSASSTAMGGC